MMARILREQVCLTFATNFEGKDREKRANCIIDAERVAGTIVRPFNVYFMYRCRIYCILVI